jgi:hypothetical protein
LIAEEAVIDPAGREWKVGIRWLPRRPKWIGWGPGRNRKRKREPRDPSWFDGLDLPIPDEFPGFLIVLAVIVVLLLAWFFVLPIAVFALDLLLLLLLAAAGVAARVFFRRPWIVEATTEGEVRRWPVVGFRSSREMVAEVSWALQNGRDIEGM